MKDEPLAQLAEHLTFNQGARGSNPRWLTRISRGERIRMFQIDFTPTKKIADGRKPVRFLLYSSGFPDTKRFYEV